MPKSFSYRVLILCLVLHAFAYAQSKPTYKDVLLNGKPAKLNIETGEFIQVNGNKIDTIKSLQVSTKPLENTEIVASHVPDTIASTVKDDVTVLSAPVLTKDTPTFHIVKAGETLFGLSKKYGVSLIELQKVNSLSTTLITVGQKLRVADFDNIETPDIWVVKKGHTLYSIAKKYNTTVKAIKALNNLKSNTIYIGQKLRLK
ncbi:LysM peptidoglycan-binding domain-containing protein [Hyunsoonleella ulvae]|uniref:LysM peptidoglycan-binding domain-containing protein n=1 Tax=Hyunsoonleella ulvae TaxID=2799948 RepID=UPI0019398D2D|nr:LysM peptidoglycan-binding domain-containing protein [Hyunsoonleella ulvae]